MLACVSVLAALFVAFGLLISFTHLLTEGCVPDGGHARGEDHVCGVA